MEGLRRRVAEKKAQGLYGVDALMADSTEGDEPFGMDELEKLRELAVQRVELEVTTSTKPVVGGVVSKVKRLLVRGASQPMYGMSARSTAFNAALLAYLATLAREVSALERSARADRAAAAAAEAELAALRADLAAALAGADDARARVARLADAALPERIARLERGPATAPAAPAPPPPPGGGSLRLRLEATEADEDRDARLAGYAEALGTGRVVHAGAGSGWALGAFGPAAEGVEADAELVAAAEAEGRSVRHADPVAYVGALAPGSVDGILATGLVERLDGRGLAAFAAAAAQALAPGGLVVVEGHDPAAAAADPAFWRDPDRRRPLHPDAVRMALEAAGLGETVVVPDPGGTAGRRYAVHARP